MIYLKKRIVEHGTRRKNNNTEKYDHRWMGNTSVEIQQTSEDVQNRRLSLLREECKRHDLGDISDDFNVTRLHRKVTLLYSDTHKFILCEIPKCASSSMKKVLLTVEKLVNTTNATEIKSELLAHELTKDKLNLRQLRNATEITKRLEAYKRLIIVRDPLYRLLSAYRDKLEKGDQWNKYFAGMSRKIHKNISADGMSNKLATFDEFLRFAALDRYGERHWHLYHNLCLPCTIRYDFIAHVETINEDMAAFMKLVGMKNITFPANYAPSNQTDQEKLYGYLASVPDQTIENIYKSYRLDFELFGFSKPSIF